MKGRRSRGAQEQARHPDSRVGILLPFIGLLTSVDRRGPAQDVNGWMLYIMCPDQRLMAALPHAIHPERSLLLPLAGRC